MEEQLIKLFHSLNLPLHFNKTGNKEFTNYQRVSIIILFYRSKKSLRDFIVEFQESKWISYLGLTKIPQKSTLHDWIMMFDMKIVRKKSKKFVEIKVSSSRDSRILCGSRQLENYCHRVLKELDKYKRNTSAEYAFFRYEYDYNKKEDKDIPSLNPQELGRQLAKRTRDLIVLPLNLLFAILMNTPGYFMNHQASKSDNIEHYWRINARNTKLLREGDISKLVGDSFSLKYPSMKEILCLGDIKVDIQQSPQNIFYDESEMNPFRMVIYSNESMEKWRESFMHHHEDILERTLLIKDIYRKSRELPF